MAAIARTWALSPLLLVVGPVYGELSWELPPPLPQSMLSFDYGADNADGWNHQFSASLAGPMQLQFNLVYGESSVVSDTAELETDTRSIGVATDPLAAFGMDLTYETWGSDGELTIDTLRLGLTFNAQTFSFSLMPQQRDIRLFTRPILHHILPQVDVDGKDVGCRLVYYGLDGWAFDATYFHYGYSKDLSRLAEDFRALFIFPLETLELVSGLNSHLVSTDVTRYLPHGEIGFEWVSATSAVDGSRLDLGALHGAYELTPAWMLRIQGGVQHVDYDEDTILFLGMGLDYLW